MHQQNFSVDLEYKYMNKYHNYLILFFIEIKNSVEKK